MSTEIGLNRTGFLSSPLQGPRMVEASTEIPPSSDGDSSGIAEVRVSYAEEGATIGTVPPPPTVKGMAKSMIKALKGERASAFVDKLGERLAFERTGTRLYEVLISKSDAYGSWDGGPSRDDLETIRREEFEHFGLLMRAFQQIGADPTAMTPSADVVAVATGGIVQVLADPRTNLRECLDAILIAELTDNAGWEILVDLAHGLEHDDLAESFEEALADEQRHEALVRGWLRAALSAESGAALQATRRPNGHAARLMPKAPRTRVTAPPAQASPAQSRRTPAAPAKKKAAKAKAVTKKKASRKR